MSPVPPSTITTSDDDLRLLLRPPPPPHGCCRPLAPPAHHAPASINLPMARLLLLLLHLRCPRAVAAGLATNAAGPNLPEPCAVFLRVEAAVSSVRLVLTHQPPVRGCPRAGGAEGLEHVLVDVAGAADDVAPEEQVATATARTRGSAHGVARVDAAVQVPTAAKEKEPSKQIGYNH